MDIEKKKKMLVVIKSVVRKKRGSFTLKELKEEMSSILRYKNFNNAFENEKEICEFLNKIKSEKRLFKYKEEDMRYFFVH